MFSINIIFILLSIIIFHIKLAACYVWTVTQVGWSVRTCEEFSKKQANFLFTSAAHSQTLLPFLFKRELANFTVPSREL